MRQTIKKGITKYSNYWLWGNREMRWWEIECGLLWTQASIRHSEKVNRWRSLKQWDFDNPEKSVGNCRQKQKEDVASGSLKALPMKALGAHSLCNSRKNVLAFQVCLGTATLGVTLLGSLSCPAMAIHGRPFDPECLTSHLYVGLHHKVQKSWTLLSPVLVVGLLS